MRRDPATDNVCRLLAEEGFRVIVGDPGNVRGAWQGAAPPHALLVDESLDPVELADALERKLVHTSAPVFVIARRLPDRDQYLAWLQAGAWDILKIPLENVALALRLHNILRGQRTRSDPAVMAGRYSFDSLARVADETLSLARRYDRPLHCVALALTWQDASHDEKTVVSGLADALQRLTRRSDLIGIADDRTLLLLLPDTDEAGATTFLTRLEESLQQELRDSGVPAVLSCGLASAEGSADGAELLETAVGAVR